MVRIRFPPALSPLRTSFSGGKRGKVLTVARWIGRGTFKAAALIGAFVLIIALWLWDASILTRAADQNLQLIKAATRVLPPDWASKTESALRIFGADRALLLVEGVAVPTLIMLAIPPPFPPQRPYPRQLCLPP